jgi:putative ABC transport system permease protein
MVRRYLRFDQDQPFIFLSALLAFLGILLGVMVLIIAMALMNGFDAEFRKKTDGDELSADDHAEVLRFGR